MASSFEHPPHPATRNPHTLPDFAAHPDSPLLYLPPLLSSLPEQLPPLNIATPTGHLPLVTETRLPDIDPTSLSLHKALHNFRPLNSHYASLQYAEAFNWSELSLLEDEQRDWYCVVFRSKRKSGSDGDSLYEADRKAHEEAIRNGGLILYWYGIPDKTTGLNLATCIWQSRKHATAANSRPHHIQAMKLAAKSYDIYELERYVLSKVAGETGVSIKPYAGGDVGW